MLPFKGSRLRYICCDLEYLCFLPFSLPLWYILISFKHSNISNSEKIDSSPKLGLNKAPRELQEGTKARLVTKGTGGMLNLQNHTTNVTRHTSLIFLICGAVDKLIFPKVSVKPDWLQLVIQQSDSMKPDWSEAVSNGQDLVTLQWFKALFWLSDYAKLKWHPAVFKRAGSINLTQSMRCLTCKCL